MARTRAQDYDEKRGAILKGAAKLFAERGYSGASVKMIADACGMSKALLYHYYTDKEELLFDILETHLEGLVSVVEGAAEEDEAEPRARLERLCAALLEAYRDAGADILSVHPESGAHLHRTLGRIRQLGAKAGIVFNPATPLSILEEVVELVDLVLIMSVNPGFGGQTFIDSALAKIERARGILDRAGSAAHLQVDGGVTSANAAACVAAGADALVAGSFVFKGDYATNIAALKARPDAA